MSGGSTGLDVRGLEGQGEEYTADSKCNEKPLRVQERNGHALTYIFVKTNTHTSLRQLYER